jgi:hypothetical protein
LPILIGVRSGPVFVLLSILIGVDVGLATVPLILFGGAAGVEVVTTFDFIFRPAVGAGVGVGVGVGALCKSPTTRKLTAISNEKKFRFMAGCPFSDPFCTTDVFGRLVIIGVKCSSPVANGMAAESFKLCSVAPVP